MGNVAQRYWRSAFHLTLLLKGRATQIDLLLPSLQRPRPGRQSRNVQQYASSPVRLMIWAFWLCLLLIDCASENHGCCSSSSSWQTHCGPASSSRFANPRWLHVLSRPQIYEDLCWMELGHGLLCLLQLHVSEHEHEHGCVPLPFHGHEVIQKENQNRCSLSICDRPMLVSSASACATAIAIALMALSYFFSLSGCPCSHRR